jgi:hypothetical protein
MSLPGSPTDRLPERDTILILIEDKNMTLLDTFTLQSAEAVLPQLAKYRDGNDELFQLPSGTQIRVSRDRILASILDPRSQRNRA